jgi:BNR repeat-like domain
MRVPRSLLAAIALLALGLSQAQLEVTSAQAPSVTWSDARPIGEDLPSSWFPEIQADDYGTVRLVWESVRDSSDPSVGEANGGAIMLSELRDGEWTEPSDIYVKDVLNAARPILASDEEYLHLISRSPRPEGRITIQTLSALYYMRAPLTSDATDARSWSTPVRLTSGPAYWAQIQTLENGRVVVVYNQIIDSVTNQNGNPTAGLSKTALFSRVSEDYGATWGQPTRISYTTNRVARSSLVVSPVDGTLILAWDEGYDNLTGQGTAAGIFTATSTTGGSSWLVGGRLDPPQPDQRLVTFAARGSVESSTLVATGQTAMLVYRSTAEDVLLYRLSGDQGHSWSEEETIPGAHAREYLTPHNFDRLALAADAEGRIILAFVGQDPNTESGLSVQAMTFEDGVWSSPWIVAAPTGYPEYPRLAVSGGNQVNMTFFVRDQAFVEHGQYIIWTVSGTTSAPRVEPLTRVETSDPGLDTQPSSAASPASDGGEVQVEPYPSVPAKAPVISTSGKLESPASTISRPILKASLLTIGFLLFSIVIFKIAKKVAGF